MLTLDQNIHDGGKIKIVLFCLLEKTVRCGVIELIIVGTYHLMKIKKGPNESFSPHLIHNLV